MVAAFCLFFTARLSLWVAGNSSREVAHPAQALTPAADFSLCHSYQPPALARTAGQVYL